MDVQNEAINLSALGCNVWLTKTNARVQEFCCSGARQCMDRRIDMSRHKTLHESKLQLRAVKLHRCICLARSLLD